MVNYPKRLIEVDLPIKRISEHARREKSIRHGHISTLHIWWARRPLAACRAVICASLWPDPADTICPPDFRERVRVEMLAWTSHERQRLLSAASRERFEKARQNPALFNDSTELRSALLDFIADFANWDNSTVKEYLETSRVITQTAHEALGGASNTRPLVVDPFAGGGSIPLEALRVGADTFASDLNPVPVLLNKVVLEYIPKYGQRLADEVRKWGEFIKKEAKKELGEFYPNDLNGSMPVAYIWARTIQCEGPNCGVKIPLMRSTLLSKRPGRAAHIVLSADPKEKRIVSTVTIGKGNTQGTILRGKPTCPLCGYTTALGNVKKQFKSRSGGAVDARLMAVVLDTGVFRDPIESDYTVVANAKKRLEEIKLNWNKKISFIPDEGTTHYHTFVNRAAVYGLNTWEDFYNIRQRLFLGTLCRIVSELDLSDLKDENFQRAVRTLLAFAINRGADYWSSLATWAGDFVAHTFGRQALPFVWDFAEVNPLANASGNWSGAIGWIVRVVERELKAISNTGHVTQENAADLPLPDDSAAALITDPPYYYAIQYADLSDYFYVWFRRSLGGFYPELFSEITTPKDNEAIVQSPGDQDAPTGKNRTHYERIMRGALASSRRVLGPNGIAVIVFANATAAGWEALLDATISQGWIITASWPIDTERPGRVISSGRAVLASSVHLVCRPRENQDGSIRSEEIGDWRDVLQELPRRIHEWMPRLAEEGVVGADAIFACLGPALEIFSKYSHVEKANGEVVTLKEYLEQVWAAVAKEALTLVFKDADTMGFEADARLTAMWLWTLNAGRATDNSEALEEDDEDDEKVTGGKIKGGFVLEYDAARKIAQGLGADLEKMDHLIEIKGDTARLIPVEERARFLFGKEDTDKASVVKVSKRKNKKENQSDFFAELMGQESVSVVQEKVQVLDKQLTGKANATVLDKVHQSMILFAVGRGEALKRFLVEDGIGQDQRFWHLAQALSALYPSSSEEKRWVDGVLARKKVLGF